LFSGDQFTFQRYAWATSVVWARSVMVAGAGGAAGGAATEPVLVPVLDGLQHDHRVNTSLRVDEAGARLVMTATQAYAGAGAPVLINWGERPNAVLLLNQGYVTTDNPYDYVTMSIRMSEDDPLHGMKMKMLRQLGLDANDTYLLRNDRAERQMVPESLLRSLRVQLLSWDDAKAWRRVGEGRLVGLENELSVLRTVVGAVDQMLTLYPTTGAEDGQLMAAHQQATAAADAAGDDAAARRAVLVDARARGALLSTRRIKAILLRYPEKAVLLAVKLWCHQRWNEILVEGFPSANFVV
jgi:hypothetical protein